MRFVAFAACFALFVELASGQGGSGAISGSVSDPFGHPLAGAAVQAKNGASGKDFKAASSGKGGYALQGLPPGAYDISANMPGLKGVTRKGVNVEAGKTMTLDLRLEETTQLGTLGEDTLAITADQKKHAPPSGPAPRTADGKPDLSGIWWTPTTVDAGKPEFTAQAEAVAKQRTDNNRIDSPQTHCLPGAVLRLGPVYELVQSHDILVEISDDDSPGFHQIYLGRPHREDPTPSWYGDSVGHWEGDTLVVDRIAFHDSVWLDQAAHPHSEALHVVERYKRPDLGHLETEITVEDPGVLKKPWTMKRVSELAPTERIFEFICSENNKDLSHLVGK